LQDSISKNNQSKIDAEVVECLLGKHKALSSNPIPTRKKEKSKGRALRTIEYGTLRVWGGQGRLAGACDICTMSSKIRKT
jgi:hypothetical protein